MRSTTTAVCTRSPRNLGNTTPRQTAPTWCPARPTRCSPLATRRRRLDLDHQVDGAHVDAELEAARRDHRGQPARLEVVLDLGALLLAHRAVVRPGEHGGAPPRRPPAAMICAGLRAARRRAVDGSGGRRSARRAASSRSAQISFSRAVSRSASRRELVNTSVERCVGDEVDDALLDVRPDRGPALRRPAAGPLEVARWAAPSADHVGAPARRPRGPTPCRRRLHDLDRAAAGEEAGTSSTGRTVADSPIRCAGLGRAARRAAPARAPGARRAWCRRRRAPRRR